MKQEIIKKAYNILNKVTPLKYDCGVLCGSLCCRNTSEKEMLGMWLLPGEKEILTQFSNYTFTKAEDGTECVYCNGSCNRETRPFSCRIYPYYASLTDTPCGKTDIQIKLDPRAHISCPIAQKHHHIRPSIEFLSCTKSAIRVLLQDNEIRADLYRTSDFLKSIEEMRKKLLYCR